MKKIIYVMMILLVMGIVAADEQKVIGTMVVVDIKNGTFNLEVEGGTNIPDIDCDVFRGPIKYNLTKGITVETCEGETLNSCEDYFKNFTISFGVFTDAYNKTVGDFWDNCINTKETNTMLAKQKLDLQEDLDLCVSGQNFTETKWYDLYVESRDQLQECLKTPSFQSEYNTCKKDLIDLQDESKDRTWKTILITAILVGGAAYIFYFRKETAKQPAHRLPPG